VDDQIRSLSGRTLCRPCDAPWRHRAASAWWFALPVLAVGGVVIAARARRRAVAVLPALVAVFLAVPYLFMIDYAAPRFLLPAYALLAFPVAECLWWLVTGADGRLRPAMTVLVALALCGHLTVQYSILSKVAGDKRQVRKDYDALAAGLRRTGLRPPCIISGDTAVPIAFAVGCSSRESAGADASITPAGLTEAARHQPVAVIVRPGGRPPRYARRWHPVPLQGSRRFKGFRAYLAPPPPSPAARRTADRREPDALPATAAAPSAARRTNGGPPGQAPASYRRDSARLSAPDSEGP
jgi:hypothetical protein